MVRPDPPPSSESEEIHLTPWDLRMLTVEYIQDGIVLPKPNREPGRNLVDDHLSPAFARALRCFYPLAGRLRLVVGERGDTATLSLLCTGEGAELVHAAAPGVTAADVAAWPPPRDTPREPVSSLFPLNGLLCVDAAASPGSGGGSRKAAPLLAAQVTELADAVFVAVSLNHAAGDGTTFWHFINTWSYLARGGGADSSDPPPPPPPVLKRWFPDGYTVPVPLQFAKVKHAVQQRRHPPPLQECAFHFSGESVRNLKVRANAKLALSSGETTATVSSLQALLAHLWRSVCRARRLEPSQSTAHVQFVGCRGRVKGVPAAGYVGNAVVPCRAAASTAGEVTGENGLGRAAWLLARAVASWDEAALVRESLDRWVKEQRFAPPAGKQAVAAVVTGNSPRLDVYGNDFGWGKPVAVRCGPGNAADGKCTVYEGRGGGGAICLEVCLAPDAMARLVADEEFMDAVAAPPCP